MHDLRLSPERISWPTWIGAGFVAFAVHIGCIAWATSYLYNSDPDPELGTAAIEIGLEPLAPRFNPTEMPPGPDAEESAPSPPMVEQTQSSESTVVLRETLTQRDDSDSVDVATEADKPKQDEVVAPSTPTTPSVATVAAEATAIPTSEMAKEAARSVAPEQGIGSSSQRIRATWQKELVAHFDRHKRYPAAASDEGMVVVKLTIDESGHIVSSSILRGSAGGLFDDAALSMIQRSDPVPRPPAVVAQAGLTFTLPIIFRVKR
jgi:protein TonB